MFKPIYIYDINILQKLDLLCLRKNRDAKELYDEITINYSNSHPNIKRYMEIIEDIEYYNNDDYGYDYDYLYNNYNYYDADDMICSYYLLTNEDIKDKNICLLSCDPNAINYIEKNINYDKEIDWNWLSTNPLAIDLLKANPDKINYKLLSLNKNVSEIFDLNKEMMRQKAEPLKTELLTTVLNPDRLERLCKKYNICLIDLVHIYN